MDVPRALAQIAEIHTLITRADVYRGYRSIPIAASGAIGLAAVWVQPYAVGPADPTGFAAYWIAVAVTAGLIGASEILYNYIVNDNEVARRRTRKVTFQFLPSLAAGAVITGALVHLSPTLVALLPGLWAICFGIGTFASRPYLPRASGWVALYYYVAGMLLLWTARGPDALAGWHVGGTFGMGQMLAALVLYWNIERLDPPNGRERSTPD